MIQFINADSVKLSNFTDLQSNDIVIIYNNNYHVAGVVDMLAFGTDDITLSFILYSLSYNGKQIDLTPHEVKIELGSKTFDVVIAGLFGIIYNQL